MLNQLRKRPNVQERGRLNRNDDDVVLLVVVCDVGQVVLVTGDEIPTFI